MVASLRFPQAPFFEEFALPSYFAATSRRYHLKSVSGLRESRSPQQPAPDSLSLPREKPALGICESKALRAKPFAEHAVLGQKVVDRHLLPSLEESGHQQDEELQHAVLS